MSSFQDNNQAPAVRSMTGYGSRTLNSDGWSISWEIRSVNNRYLDIKWRIPHTLYFLQGKWEKIIRTRSWRGRLDIALNLRIHDPDVLDLSLDQAAARAMLAQLEKLAGSTGYAFAPDLNQLLRNSSLWQEGMSNIQPGLIKDLETCLTEAMDKWNLSRHEEGSLLLGDISGRISSLESILHELSDLARDNTLNRFNDLKQKISRIMDELSLEMDENRILQELVILTDRLDVSEEITRLGVHMQAMKDILARKGETGRKLDFTLQEAFREINTCANKCQNTEMSRLAVDFKAELEKCREQAQNLE